MVAVADKVVVVTGGRRGLVDDVTVNVKAALSGPVENLAFSLAR